jgi:hypothetical protein
MNNHHRMKLRETPKVLKEIKRRFDYNAETGELIYKIKTTKRGIGDVAGCRQGRYMRVGILGLSYPVHRIVWALHYGEFAPQIIDHIDGDSFNNRVENLRLTDVYLNGLNRHRPSPINTYGFKNISLVSALEKRLNPPKVYTRWSVALFTQKKRPLQRKFKRLRDAIKYRNKMLKQMGLPYENIDNVEW